MTKKRNIKKNNTKKKAEKNAPKLGNDVKRGISVVLLFLASILFVLGFFGVGGFFGSFLNKTGGIIFGWGKWLFPIALALIGGILFRKKSATFYTVKIIGLGLLFFSLLGFFHIFFPENDFLQIAKSGEGGGYIGFLEAKFLVKFTGKIAGVIVLIAFAGIGAMVAFNFSVLEFFVRIFEKNKKGDNEKNKSKKKGGDNLLRMEEKSEKKDIINNEKLKGATFDEKSNSNANIKNIKFVDDDLSTENNKDSYAEKPKEVVERLSNRQKQKMNNFKIKNKTETSSGEWEFPPLDLLDIFESNDISSGNIEDRKNIILETFANFGIELKDGGVKIGPTVTQYSFRPPVGVKLNKIMALGDNLSLALAVHPIRIEAPIPGKSLIGIEVPNEKGEIINLRKLLESDVFRENDGVLKLALGEDVEGEYVVADLRSMPHLLVAGATGTGKSVCVNSIILSLLFQYSPDDLKMILIDPKRVELSLYNKIPHLLSDVIVDNKKVINALRWAVNEMTERYKVLQSVGSRDLESYHSKMREGVKRKYIDPDTGKETEESLKKLPYIVIIIDELADLMLSHGKEVEGVIMRLTQMARAVGIHLIISTQRPSVNILTGVIKANITTRIALKVATQVDSRTIITMPGAEKLLGGGDMIFLTANSLKPRRVQCSFVSEEEVKRVVDFIRKQSLNIEKDNNSSEKTDVNKGINEKNIDGGRSGFFDKEEDTNSFQKIDFSQMQTGDENDELYGEIKEFITRVGKVSASLLQRNFRIGFNRAARIVDDLERDGIIGPAEGNKPREVLIKAGNQKEVKGVNYEDDHKDQEEREKWKI